MYPVMITGRAITVTVDNQPHVIGVDEPQFEQLKQAIRDKAWDRVPGLLSISKALEAFSDGEVEVTDGEVLYRGHVVHSSVADKLMELMQEGFDPTPLSRFLARVENNPSIDARQELYDFCEANGFTIDEDGYIIAYKRVDAQYKDIYTHKIDNSVGAVVSMPREEVNPDRRMTCSVGLHFAAWDYAKNSYSRNPNDHMMVVRVDPADVVAIPTDYNNQKGRAWRYQVIAEVIGDQPLAQKTFTRDDFTVKPVDASSDDGDVTAAQVQQALNDANGVIGGTSGAAAALGLTPRSFRRRMAKFGITR